MHSPSTIIHCHTAKIHDQGAGIQSVRVQLLQFLVTGHVELFHRKSSFLWLNIF